MTKKQKQKTKRTMTINEAIQKAIENGWLKDDQDTREDILQWYQDGVYIDYNPERLAVLDSDFWKALGRAEGWGVHQQVDEDNVSSDIPEWLVRWHELIDFLANGENLEDYFKQL